MKDKAKIKEIKDLTEMIARKASQCNYKVDMITPAIKARNKKIVAKTFHKIGIVVPLDANEVGYRPLNLSDGKWDNFFWKHSD